MGNRASVFRASSACASICIAQIERMTVARVFTRQQFYELVWSKPMTHLAKEFAISDVALHKICRKHGIPNPPLGWWAKKASGKKVKQTPLPAAKPGTAERITIADGDLGRETSALANAREHARILASEGSDLQAAPPHPIVDRTMAKLGKEKPSDIGLVAVGGAGVIKCAVAPQSVDRLAVILPRIVRAASLQGFQLLGGEGSSHFKSETEAIDFSISELVKRDRHVLTDAERAKDEAWQRKCDQAARRNAWDAVFLDKPRFPEWDYHPTGQLSFEFEQVYVFRGTAPRRSFRDAKIQRLENMASEIGVGLAVLAAAKTEERLRREVQHRRIEEERRERELAARVKHVEDRRTAGLGAILTELDEVDRLRRLIVMLTTEVPAEPMPRLSTFLAWAKERLAKRETRLSAQAMEDRFAVERLFGDTDDHTFVASRCATR